MSVVLDASALFAYQRKESGTERARAPIAQATMSTVCWSEVIGKTQDRGVNARGQQDDFAALGRTLEPFTPPVSRLLLGPRY